MVTVTFAFATASHNLREPIRNVSIYSQVLDRRYASALDESGREYFRSITEAPGFWTASS